MQLGGTGGIRQAPPPQPWRSGRCACSPFLLAALALPAAGQTILRLGIGSDPNGNVAFWLASDGFLNWGRYSNARVDDAFAAARRSTRLEQRRSLYRQAAERWLADRPHLILYHHRWFWAMRAGVEGFQPSPDGIIRFAGLRVTAR